MKTLGLYTVTGTREYRGHQPGEQFEAYIPPGPERRAVDRGDIRLERRTRPKLPPDWALPDGWATQQPEAPTGASLVSGGGN
jgi:hypothetical protein